MYHSVAMSVADPEVEYLRLAEHYRQMKDEELLELVPRREQLTPAAQDALAIEVRHRGLKVEGVEEKSAATGSKPAPKPNRPSFRPPSPQSREKLSDSSLANEIPPDLAGDEEAAEEEEDPYEEERKLVTLVTVWSLRDALKVQAILDGAGTPFYMGPEKATGVDQVKSDFSKGVGVQIMRVGWPWAYDALNRNYFPQDQPPSELPKDPKPLAVRCPRCKSNDVIFSGLAPVVGASLEDSPRRFRWTCDACGNEWEDEGVGKEEENGTELYGGQR